MKTFTTIIAASALLSFVTGSPIQARGNTCGSAPAGSGSVNPLSQPTGINTAQGCQNQCDADASCISFGFGTEDADVASCVCILFPVPASEVPPQSNVNIIVFDKACTSVPAVVPTASDPTGAGTVSASPATTGSNPATSSPSNAGNNPNSNGKSGNGSPKLAVRDTCGAQPTGPTGNAVSPIDTPPNISSPAACLLACQAFTGCKSCEYESPASVCLLFNVPASSLPAPTNGASFVAFDSGCPAPA